MILMGKELGEGRVFFQKSKDTKAVSPPYEQNRAFPDLCMHLNTLLLEMMREI